jgi:hypothetical protein
MIVVACPVCGTRREVDDETFSVMMECRQFMCWDVCGMDVPIFNPLSLLPFLNDLADEDEEIDDPSEPVLCIECDQEETMSIGDHYHPSGLCKGCYDAFKQRLRDGDVQGVE